MRKTGKQGKRFMGAGLAAGLLNGLFGGGGGVLLVPLLRRCGLELRQAHATALGITLPLSAVSVLVYFFKGELLPEQAVGYMAGGALGGIVGALLLHRVPDGLLRRLFYGLALFSGLRLLLM